MLVCTIRQSNTKKESSINFKKETPIMELHLKRWIFRLLKLIQPDPNLLQSEFKSFLMMIKTQSLEIENDCCEWQTSLQNHKVSLNPNHLETTDLM